MIGPGSSNVITEGSDIFQQYSRFCTGVIRLVVNDISDFAIEEPA